MINFTSMGCRKLTYQYENEGLRKSETPLKKCKDYYPFGLSFNQQTRENTQAQRYLYNGFEEQEEWGMYDYQARYYDPVLGRFINVDPAADLMRRHSPYNYAFDNPIYYIDPDGMIPTPPGDYYTENGKKIGTDGNPDGKKYIVSEKDEINSIKTTDRAGGITKVSTVSSAEVLPSDGALSESLNVIKRTEAKTNKDPKGGLHEESSLVMNDGRIIEGETGEAGFINSNNQLEARQTMPSIPDGSTGADVEVGIHSHLTGTVLKNGQIYSHDATTPSDIDHTTNTHNLFIGMKTNIIVGPLGLASAKSGISKTTGRMETTVSQPGNGVAVFRGASSKPAITLTVKAVQRILKK